MFRLTPQNHETIVYSFCAQINCTDGAEPGGNLLFDEKGNLYGATRTGGNNPPVDNGAGVAFRLTP